MTPRTFHAALAIALAAAIATTPSVTFARQARGVVTGTVFDSVSKRRLIGAKVQLVSSTQASWERSVVADENGRFRFDSVAAGTYLLGFYDAAMDSLGLESPLKQVEMKESREMNVPLAVPSLASIVAFNCRNAMDSTGLFLGVVRSAKDGLPIPHATLRVRWSELAITKTGIESRAPLHDIQSNDIGGFALCGVPANYGASIEVHGWSGPDSSGIFDLEVPISGLLRRDIYVGASTREKDRADSLSKETPDHYETFARGAGTLRGIVRTKLGRPLEKARLSLTGSGVEYVSNQDGNFYMRYLPAGTYMLEARAIGYLSETRVVDIVENRMSSVDISMDNQNQFLDTVRVMGRKPFSGFEGFTKRREMGLGHFLDEIQIRAMAPLVLTDVLRGMPGVRVLVQGGKSDSRVGYELTMFGGADGRVLQCAPNVYIDRARYNGSMSEIDQMIRGHDLRAVEVYTNSTNTPGEFYTPNACGTIILWTKTDYSRHKIK